MEPRGCNLSNYAQDYPEHLARSCPYRHGYESRRHPTHNVLRCLEYCFNRYGLAASSEESECDTYCSRRSLPYSIPYLLANTSNGTTLVGMTLNSSPPAYYLEQWNPGSGHFRRPERTRRRPVDKSAGEDGRWNQGSCGRTTGAT